MNKYKTSIEDTTDVSDTASVSSSVQDNQDIEVHTSPNLPKVHSEPSFDISKLPPGWDNGIFFNGGESGVSSFELVNNQDLPHMIDAYQSTEILGVTTDSSLKDTFRLAVAVAPGFTAAAKALYDDMNEDAESVSDNQYRALVLVSSGEMQLGRKDIQLAPAFTKAVQEALDAPGEDKSKQYDALQHVFRKYGFHYPTRVVFGGKLMFEGDTYSWLSDASKDESAFSDIDINGWISQKEQSRIMQLTEQNLQHIVADGGDESKISCGLKEWISTIAKNPKVVLRGNLRPLYDLLENTTRRKILDIYETLKQNSWIHSLYGVHVDKESAKEPAIKIASGANIRYYPTGNLPITNKRSLGCMPKEKWTAELNFSVQSYFRREVDKELAKTDWADKVLLPGLQGYCFFACKALGKIMTKERWQSKQYISRRHVFLLPGAIKATIEFEKAILDALQQPTDEEKFMELEKVFHMYGYYYPQWVTLGGKLIYQYHFVSEYDPLKYRVESILRKESSWQASGGNTSLLYDDVPDIAGWLETTAHNQALVSVADVWPMYDLFNDEISAQIRQLYTKAYYQYRPRISSSLDNRLEEETALVSLTGKEMKIDCWKGIHFDGSVAPEDAIELKNDIDITKVLVPVNVMGGPEIQYHNRITELSINMSTHAFLPDGFSSRMQLNGFDTAAIEYHIETGKVREQQMLDLDTKYIKATEALKNAVAEALTLETDMKKLHQLKKVFRRFGFYYPTCILLGGRLSMDVTSLNLAPDLSTEDTEKAIDMILASNKRKSQCIGGDSVLGGRQDWIESVQSNQARIQFASMRPLYDILHTEQRVQVQRLFNENVFHYKEIPKIPPGMHFDRIDAEYQATELVKDDISSKMVMLRHFFDQPYVEHTEQYGIDLQEAQSKATVDVDAELEFSKHMYFNLGAQAAWKERKATSSHHRDNTEQAYDVVYVIYKELFLPDYLLQPTSQFKEAISKALEVGNLDQDTYYALQDVFQRFGYYYPTRVQIGGTLILPSPLKEQSEMQTTRSYNIKERFEKFIQMCQTTEINEMSHVERNNHQDIRSTKDESGTVIAQYNQELACHFANGVLSKSIAATETLNAAGGDGVCLLWNDLNTWIQSVQSNQVIIRRKDLRPLYHLLDKWQRRQVRQTYKNIVLADERIRYNCPLLLTAYEQPDSEESESAVADHHAVEKALYLQLLKQRFDDVNEAIEYCRSACKDAGFSISEEYIDDCSHGIRCSQCEQQSLTRGDSDQIVTGWSIELLFDQTWYFYLPYEKNEVRHNHTLKAVNGENWDTTPAIQSSMILEIKHTALVTNEECKTARHVHYGDLIHLRLIYSENSAMMTLLNDELLLKVMKVGDLEKLSGTIKALRDTYLSASGCLKGVADKEDEEITVQDPDSDYLWKIVRYPSDSEKLENRRVEADFHSRETEACDLSCQDCVRSNDVILFESQAALGGSKRLYLKVTEDRLSCFISEGPTMDALKEAGWNVIRNIYDGIIRWHTTYRKHDVFRLSSELRTELMFSNVKHKKFNRLYVQYILQSGIDMVGVEAYQLEFRNDDYSDVNNSQEDEDNGPSNVDQSTEREIEILQARADDGDSEACYELAVHLWETKEYQKALDMYEKAAQLSEPNAYYALGNLYRSGFSSDHFTIAQNSQVAFMYYCIGSTCPGDINYTNYPNIMMVAQYYEKGYNKLPDVRYDKARQWYMSANYYLRAEDVDRPPALLAMGKLEHSWANATSDPLEAKQQRQNAFNIFHRCRGSEPYAKFMVAMYHLYGWEVRQPVPGLAFNMLLSLVESGIKEVPVAIAKCYEEGVGVERDPVKAAAYREFASQMHKE